MAVGGAGIVIPAEARQGAPAPRAPRNGLRPGTAVPANAVRGGTLSPRPPGRGMPTRMRLVGALPGDSSWTWGLRIFAPPSQFFHSVFGEYSWFECV